MRVQGTLRNTAGVPIDGTVWVAVVNADDSVLEVNGDAYVFRYGRQLPPGGTFFFDVPFYRPVVIKGYKYYYGAAE